MNRFTPFWSRCKLAISVLVAAVLFVAIFFVRTDVASAKDLSNRLGIGFKNQSSVDLPSMAVQYWPGSELGLSVSLGLDTEPTKSKFSGMAKIYRVIFPEDNLNFYLGAGAGVLSLEEVGKNQSGFELMGFAGCEFFLPGLENVGWSFELGTAITSISSGTRFRTFGDSPLRAGAIFYF